MEERKINIPLIIALVVVLAMLCGFGYYYHKNIYIPNLQRAATETAQIDIDSNGPQKAGERVLLAELKDIDFQLYKDGDYIIVVQDGQETEFSDWNSSIGRRTPEIYYFDFNEDGKEDIVIRGFEGEDEKTGEALYGLYVLYVSTDEAGKYSYKISYTNSAGWLSIFNSMIKCQANQLTLTPKRIQFVMAYTSNTVSYDNETGLLVGAGHPSYILAPTAPDGNYCTIKNWYMGPCVINIDPKTHNITVDITIYINYNEISEAQTAGKIKSGLTYRDGEFFIAEKSVVFDVENDAVTPDPVIDNVEPWEITIKASGAAADKKVISNLALECSFNYKTMKTGEFNGISNLSNEAAGIEKITADQNELKIHLKSGYSFSPEVVTLPNFKIILRYSQKDYDIAQTATISEENGRRILTVTYDTTYSAIQMNKFKIIIGNS